MSSQLDLEDMLMSAYDLKYKQAMIETAEELNRIKSISVEKELFLMSEGFQDDDKEMVLVDLKQASQAIKDLIEGK